MPTAVTLRQLEYFVAVARTRSMADAAVALHVSPAAVSLGIGELERILGAQLFVRVRHQPLTLTAPGADLLADASMVIAQVEEFEARTVDRLGALTGTLHIGCFTTLAPSFLPGLVSAMSVRHPGIRVEAVEGSLDALQADILRGTCELALVYGLDLRSGIDADHVAAARPYVVLPVGHRCAGQAAVHLADLADDPMILLDTPPSRHHALSVLSSIGVTPTVERVTLNFETLRSFVARGHGWGFLVQRPRVDSSYEGLPIVAVPIADDIEPVPIVVATASGNRRSRRATACIDVWRDLLGERPDPTSDISYTIAVDGEPVAGIPADTNHDWR